MRGPRFAFAAGSWHVLAAARAGERVRVGEGTERGNNKTRSGPLRAGARFARYVCVFKIQRAALAQQRPAQTVRGVSARSAVVGAECGGSRFAPAQSPRCRKG